MLTERSLYLLGGVAALLPLLAIAALMWRRFYHDDPDNAARRIAKNSLVPTAMRFGLRALDLIFTLILYDTLEGQDIGPYIVAALLVASYLGTFTDFGLGVLLTREAAKNRAAAPQLFGATLALRGALVLAAIPVTVAIVAIYNLLGGYQLIEPITSQGQQVIWVLLLTLVPGAYSNAVTALYNAAERMEVPATIEFITQILSFFGRIAALLLGFGILGIAWSAVVVSCLTALIYLPLQRRDFFRPTLEWKPSLFMPLVPLALPLMFNNLLNIVFFRFDFFIIKALGEGRGDLLATQYNMAYQIIGIATILPPIITFAIFPVLSRRAAGERAALAMAQNKTLQVLLLLACPLAVGISALAPDLVVFFGGSNYADYLPISADVLRILAWFLPLSFVNGLLQYSLIAINQQRAITRAFLVGAGFNLVANLLLIPPYGLYAASVITVLSEIVLLAVFLPLLRRESIQPPLLTLAWRPLLAALLMGGCMLGVRALIPSAASGMSGLIAGAVAPPVYAGLLWLFGAFGAEERALARRVLGRS